MTEFEGALVRLFVAGQGAASVQSEKTTDDTGSCLFELVPGEYRVEVAYPEYVAASTEVKLKAGKIESAKLDLQPTFGYITLVGTDLTVDAAILVDGAKSGEAGLVRSPEGWVRLKTSPGKHALRVEREGRKAFADEVTVEAGFDRAIAVALPELRASIRVHSIPGAHVYLGDRSVGTIPRSATLLVEDLVPGKSYALRVEIDDYQPASVTVIPALDREVAVDVSLERLSTSVRFEDLFYDLSRWKSPTTWSAADGVLTVSGPGTGTPIDKRYRDFDMSFYVRLMGRTGAAWILRARDDQNYYLVYLCGPDSSWKNQLRVYEVRDGKVDLGKPLGPVTPIPVNLSPKDTYRIDVRVDDGRVQHWITSGSAGQKVSMGFFELPAQATGSGNIGFTTIDGAPFQVNGFFVAPLEAADAGKVPSSH